MRTSARGNRISAGGFTLFELMVVLVLVAAAAGIVAPAFTRSLRGLELETAARNLIIQMRQARSQAIGTHRVFRVILVQHREEAYEQELSGDYYVLTDDYERVLETVPLPDGARVVIPEEASAPLRVSFYSNGRSSGGLFAFQNDTRRIVVWVDPITGFAKAFQREEELRDFGIPSF